MLTQTTPLYKYNDRDSHIAFVVDGGNLILGETRSEEAAQENAYTMRMTIPLAEAIAAAKALLASQAAAERVEDDARYEAWLEAEYERRQDYLALVDSAVEHDIRF